MRAGREGFSAMRAGAQDKLRVLLTWAEIIRSIEVSVRKVTDSRDGRVTGRFNGEVQMAETSAQAVTVRTSEAFSCPGRTFQRCSIRG